MSGDAIDRSKRASLLRSGSRFGVDNAWLTNFVAMAVDRVRTFGSSLYTELNFQVARTQ